MKEENESYREFLMSEKKPIDFWFLKIKKKKFWDRYTESKQPPWNGRGKCKTEEPACSGRSAVGTISLAADRSL
jgi:hypothetical protein